MAEAEPSDSSGDVNMLSPSSTTTNGPNGPSSQETDGNVDSQNSSKPDSTTIECPICLQSCVHPVELPCRHIFCFLCIKGVAMQTPHVVSRCAICRSSIPSYVLSNPKLKNVQQLYEDPSTETGFQWFYESRSGGWWGYEKRTMEELERAFTAKQDSCQLMIAGNLYEIDFANMVQYRTDNRNLFRRMKRDLPSTSKKGIAGIRVNFAAHTTGDDDGVSGSDSIARPLSRPQGNSSPYQHNGPRSASAPANAPLNMHVIDSDDDDEEEEFCQCGCGCPIYDGGSDDFSGEDGDGSESEVLDEDEDEIERTTGTDDVDEELLQQNDTNDGTRSGARAPIERSGRSTSSSNITPPSPTSPNYSTNPASPACVSSANNSQDSYFNDSNNSQQSQTNGHLNGPGPGPTGNGCRGKKIPRMNSTCSEIETNRRNHSSESESRSLSAIEHSVNVNNSTNCSNNSVSACSSPATIPLNLNGETHGGGCTTTTSGDSENISTSTLLISPELIITPDIDINSSNEEIL